MAGEPYITDHSDDEGTIIAYMNKVSFDHELGAALGPTPVYCSEKDLEKCQPRVKAYGIVEVEIKLRKVIRESDFSKAIKEGLKRRGEESRGVQGQGT